MAGLTFKFGAWLIEKIGSTMYERIIEPKEKLLDEVFDLVAKRTIKEVKSLYEVDYHDAIDLFLTDESALEIVYRMIFQDDNVPESVFDAYIDIHTLPKNFLPSVINALRKEALRDPTLAPILQNLLITKQINTSNYFLGRMVEDLDAKRRLFDEDEAVKSIRMLPYHRYVDDTFWKSHQLPNERKAKILDRYLTRQDANVIPEIIANNLEVHPADIFDVLDGDGMVDQKTIGGIFSLALSESFSLINIFADSGVGKSTYLLWIAKHIYRTNHVIIIKQLSYTSEEDIIRKCIRLFKLNNKPVVFLIDDIGSFNISKRLVQFVSTIRDSFRQYGRQVVFIFSEQNIRYNTSYGNELENLFSGSVQCIQYKPVDKQLVFEATYNILLNKNPNLADSQIKGYERALFINPEIPSLSVSTSMLLDSLKSKNEISHEFDWNRWYNFVNANPEYLPLRGLFAQTVSFFQFGIKIPLKFFTAKISSLISEAVNALGTDDSPIVISEDGSELFLRNENVATHFLLDAERRALVIDAFNSFLENISDEHSARLFRKIRKLSRKRSEELEKSVIAFLITPEKCFDIISKYLNRRDITALETDKMKMEKALVLMEMNNDDEAEAVLVDLSNTQSDTEHNYAKDQLARFFLRSKKNYQKAFDTYAEIFQNGGHYAILSIYQLLQRCERENIQLESIANSGFSTNLSVILTMIQELILGNKSEQMRLPTLDSFTKHELIKALILEREFKSAQVILESVKKPIRLTAECHNRLAKGLTFTKENIDNKRYHYEKAIDIDSSIFKKPNLNYSIDYAVFLYRIRRFPDSNVVLRSLIGQSSKESVPLINDIYSKKIKATTKLFFSDIPDKNDIPLLEKFLLSQCKNADPLVGFQQSDYEILKGFLMLKTVAYHSQRDLPEVYFLAIKRMASCYMHNAKKNWNDLSEFENRIIAASLLDKAFALNGRNFEVQENMIKNLLAFDDNKKTKKALFLSEKFVSYYSRMRSTDIKFININENRRSILYRLKGTANMMLKNYERAISDYEISLRLLNRKGSENKSTFLNNKCSTLNNMVTLICNCVEEKVLIKGYTLQNAKEYCDTIQDVKPDFYFLKTQKERVDLLSS